MKLSRREFLKALAAVGAGAGAVLAGVGGKEVAEAEKTSLGTLYSQTGHLSLDRVDAARHELLSEAHPDFQPVRQPGPFAWIPVDVDGQEYYVPTWGGIYRPGEALRPIVRLEHSEYA